MNKKKMNIKFLYVAMLIITLIFIIIGSTFAYFGASKAGSGITYGGTTNVNNLRLSVSLITDDANNIIPLNLIINQKLSDNTSDEYVDYNDQFNDAMINNCIDSNNNNVCSVYKVVIENKNDDNNIEVIGKLKINSESKNTKWMLINADTKMVDSESSSIERLDGSKASRLSDFNPVGVNVDGYLTYSSSEDDNGYIYNYSSSIFLSSKSSSDNVNYFNYKTFYVLVWLEEIGDVQENDDASKSYTGTVSFDAVSGPNGNVGIVASFVNG